MLICASVEGAFKRGYSALAGTDICVAPVSAQPPLFVAIGAHKVSEWWHCA